MGGKRTLYCRPNDLWGRLTCTIRPTVMCSHDLHMYVHRDSLETRIVIVCHLLNFCLPHRNPRSLPDGKCRAHPRLGHATTPIERHSRPSVTPPLDSMDERWSRRRCAGDHLLYAVRSFFFNFPFQPSIASTCGEMLTSRRVFVRFWSRIRRLVFHLFTILHI